MNLTRYIVGGDMWEAVGKKYGREAAEQLSNIAEAGDLTQFNFALSSLNRSGVVSPVQNSRTSTLWNFTDQLLTDPLAAPADSLNNQLGKAFKNIFGSPWILVALAAVVFFWIGGAQWSKGKLAR